MQSTRKKCYRGCFDRARSGQSSVALFEQQETLHNAATGGSSKENREMPMPPTRLEKISSDQIRRTAVHLGSGSYVSCYLGLYRGIRVVVKELRVNLSNFDLGAE